MLCFEAEKAQGKSLEHREITGKTQEILISLECGHPD